MLVKAKWNVKDASGWHRADEVFHTENDLGDAVEVLDAPKKAEPKAEKKAPVKEPEKEQRAEAVETATELEAASEEAPRSTSRRKKVSK